MSKIIDIQAEYFNYLLHKGIEHTPELEAIFMAGARTMAQDTIYTLDDYSAGLAGCDDLTYSPCRAMETARDSLFMYYRQVLYT